MVCGMAAAGALMRGDMQAIRLFVICLPGLAPFLLLSSVRRAGVTGLIERTVPDEMTQSEAIAVRCASMIHSWARLYEDTAQMMRPERAAGGQPDHFAVRGAAFQDEHGGASGLRAHAQRDPSG